MTFRQTYESLKGWAIQNNVGRKLLVFLVVGSILSVITTYVVLTNAPPFIKNRGILLFLLGLDFVFLMIFATIIARYVATLWAERRSDQAGSKLHSRIVAIFSLLVIAPTILIAGFSAVFFNIVIQSWFNQRVETAIGESVAVAGAYKGEHQKIISANAQAMAVELAFLIRYFPQDSEAISQRLAEQIELRALDEAVVFTNTLQILGRSQFPFSSLKYETNLVNGLEDAKTSPVVYTYTNPENDRIRALVSIDPLANIYLLVGREVSPTVLSRLDNLSKAAHEYNRLETEGSKIALKFAIIFVGIATLLLLTAVLGGILFANKLARPIRRLIQASDEVCKGNLAVRIAEEEETEELSSLTSAFNRMTSQLESQRDALLIANEELDERRRFTEAVLADVSAGVIGLDAKENIHLSNQSASKLLGIDLSCEVGKKLIEVIPEMASLFEGIKEEGPNFIEKHVVLNRNGHGHTLLVRLSLNQMHNKVTEYVITFDDITQLQAAQRKAAWSEMARRIAHEIKNPLTPIQLSAERLKRRYTKQITQDSETFHNCVDTIIRQVGHIGQMVGEFSSFARMPVPNIKLEDLVQICKEEIFLQQQGHPELKIEFHSALTSLLFPCDRGQLGQVLTNLIQNAIDAIESKKILHGHIKIVLATEDQKVILSVIDNGIGFPPEGRERLTEPYVTFRDKGTGLGLAIAKKIIEDHEGYLSFQDQPNGGAIVQVSFTYTNMFD